MSNNNLGNEWKDTAYELGGAFATLGKTLLHSIKKGVDIAYDYMNDEDKKKKQDTAKKESSSDKPEKVNTYIIEE